MNELCPMPGCRVERVAREGPDLLHIAARGTRPGGRCPDCGRASRAVHSRYRRHPADLPSLGSRVRVGLVVRRFYCRTPSCARRTFAEQPARVVAVDDWALRKGRTYGTIVVDLERRRVLDLLPDRTALLHGPVRWCRNLVQSRRLYPHLGHRSCLSS